MFSVCPFVRPICLFVTKLVNMLFWKQMNQFQCKFPQMIAGWGHEMVNFGSQITGVQS